MTIRIPAVLGALACTLLLASCGSPAAPMPQVDASSHSATTTPLEATTAPETSETPSAPPSAAAAGCDGIITAGTVDALKSQGWTSQQQEFRIGDVPVEDGLLCLWADFTTPSDHGQMYGWGAIDAKSADAAKASLQRDGWLATVDDGVTYYTEDPDYALGTDDDGFGMTYEFGDGWVRFSDTKQGLLLIEGVR